VLGIALWVITVAALAFGWAILLITGKIADIDGGQEVFVNLVDLSAPALCTTLLRRHPNEWAGLLLGISTMAATLSTGCCLCR
jgi:hypothetical protein